MDSPSDPAPEIGNSSPPRKKLGWLDKFRVAFRGVKFGVRGEASFVVHFFMAVAVVVAAALLRCELWQWCVLVGCIGCVLTAELFNSAIETLFRGLDEAARERVWPALDIAAGAVLMASIAASVVGGIVFVQQLIRLL